MPAHHSLAAVLAQPRPGQFLYHDDSLNHCPGCNHTHWHIGRTTAECAFCDMVLVREHAHGVGAHPRFIVHDHLTRLSRMPEWMRAA